MKEYFYILCKTVARKADRVPRPSIQNYEM
jgi:hypothetical protein